MKKHNKKYKATPLQRKPAERKPSGLSENKVKEIVLPLLIAFFVPFILYIQTIKFGYTNFDDDTMILKNKAFLSDFGNALHSFLTDQFIAKSSTFYRPLGTLSYMLDIQLSGGNNVWMYHLSNVLLLGLIACSLYVLLRKFQIPLLPALLSTLVFYVHPLFVSTTAHLPNRAELLLSLFAILSFIFFIDYLKSRKNLYLVLHWLTFTLALFSKETAAFLPFLFIIYFFTFTDEKHSGRIQFEKKNFILIFFYGISGLLWYWLRLKALAGSTNSDETFGINPLLSNLPILPESLAKFFLPSDMATIPCFSLFKTLSGTVIFIGILVLLFINKEKPKKKKLFCLSWFIILLVPSLLFKNPYFDYLDHRFFLPLIGILLFVLFILPARWLTKDSVKTSWVYIALIIGLSITSFIKSKAYSDPMNFYTSAIAQNPKAALAYNNRGLIYGDEGNYDKAIEDYSNAIELKADYDQAYNNRGLSYGNKGMLAEAIRDFTKAIELKPDYAQAYYNRGLTFNKQNRYDKAVADFTSAIKLKPDAILYYNRGLSYGNQKSFNEAIGDYSTAIEMDPSYSNAYNNRGAMYYYQGQMDKACYDFKKAAELGDQGAKDNVSKLCK